MGNADLLLDVPMVESVVEESPASPRRGVRARLGGLARRVGSGAGWLFGLVSLVLGLAVLASTPILQFLSLGYLLESSGRVARTGRLRDGVFGVRLAGRVGGMAVGTLISMIPLWLVGSYANSAAVIDPGGAVERGWRFAAVAVWGLTCLHLLTAFLRGGRLRRFLWPFGGPFWLRRRWREGGLYAASRDGFWDFVARFRPAYYFRLGFVGFLGTLAWLVVPTSMIAATTRLPLLGPLGMIALACVAPVLPFLQTGYAVEGRASALFGLRSARERFRHAPWAFAFALLVLLAASIPLYLLKIEMIPREAAWLPGLVFVVFLAPARLLVGWAYARSLRRESRSHWFFRLLGRLAIVVVAVVYVVVVFLSQYTSWGGVWSLYEQHAFLTPAPFWSFER
ncbi:hypothetical protein [Planctomyces sp. SH-PL62]|uniref:hypothetical protein n=1 Tax=Planctomyces sp. SH-PL62 TaxID=1636152 RepID=UPI00078D1B2B|nr:hypothetical protein [Planctomyces sp. SH-PL62]AMV37943.1 hypothetical protein VT85_10940 [Planctomyces sp. SH-PL62]